MTPGPGVQGMAPKTFLSSLKLLSITFFDSAKVNLINGLLNGSIPDSEGINIIRTTYLDQSFQNDLSSEIDPNDPNKLIITSLNEDNTIDIGDVEITNYATVPDNTTRIEEQNFDSVNVDNSLISTNKLLSPIYYYLKFYQYKDQL